VDRLGRSLSNLVAFLNDLQAKGVGLYLHQQGLDTSTPSGRAMFGMLSVFAEFERAMIRERVMAGLRRSTKKSGRPAIPPIHLDRVRKALGDGQSIRAVAKSTGVSTATVMRVKKAMQTVDQDADHTVAA
jgi:DNA invertase Pin-like site-specific DNA recombinase